MFDPISPALPVNQKAYDLGESPFWHEKCLYFTDITAGRLLCFDPATGSESSTSFGRMAGCAVPVQDGGILLGLEQEIILFKEGQEVLLTPINGGKSNHRCNDGKADPQGRLWIGCMENSLAAGQGSLYSYSPTEGLCLKKENLTLPNGMAWSPDEKTYYLIDSGPRILYAFDFDSNAGTLKNARELILFPPEAGTPDGMCIDEEGFLWIAFWGAGKVSRFDPVSGKETAVISVPAPQTTSCAFGSGDFRTLFITTAKKWLSQEDQEKFPLSGRLFAVKLPVSGLPPFYFKDS